MNGNSFVLNIFKENVETKEREAARGYSLKQLSQIVDSVPKEVAFPSKKIIDTETNNYIQIVNSTSKTPNTNLRHSNFDAEANQFLREPKVIKPNFQLEVSDLLDKLNTSMPVPTINLKFTLKSLNINALSLSLSQRYRIINIINKLSPNTVWSKQLTDTVLKLRPIIVPLDEEYHYSINTFNSICSIVIPPTTSEKMINLKNYVFPEIFPEEIMYNIYNEKITEFDKNIPVLKTVTEEPMESNKYIKNDKDFNNPSISSKRKRSIESNDLKQAKCKKPSGIGDLNKLTNIYELILKEEQFLLENPLESVHANLLLPNLNNMFKHIANLRPLLNQIEDDLERKPHLSVLSVCYLNLLKKIIVILPLRFENNDVSGDKDVLEFKTNSENAIPSKLIIKHARRAQKRLKKLWHLFKQIKNLLVAGKKMSKNYKHLFINLLKYLERLDSSLNLISDSADRVRTQYSEKVEGKKEATGTLDELHKMYVTFSEINIPKNFTISLIHVEKMQNVYSGIQNIHKLVTELSLYLEFMKDYIEVIIKEDFYKNFLNLSNKYFEIIKSVFNTFPIETIENETNSIKKFDPLTSFKEQVSIVENLVKLSLEDLKKVQRDFNLLNSKSVWGSEIFAECSAIFDRILVYFSNLDQSLSIFQTVAKKLSQEMAKIENYISSNTGLGCRNKFTGSLEELEGLYKKIYKITDPLVLKARKQINLNIVQKLCNVIPYLRKSVSLLLFYIHSLKDDIEYLHFEDAYQQYYPNLSDKYFLIINRFLSLFPIKNKIGRDIIKMDQNKNIQFLNAPLVERARLLRNLTTRAIRFINRLQPYLYRWGIENFADTGDFFDSLAQYLFNNLFYALRNVSAINYKIRNSVFTTEDLNCLNILSTENNTDQIINNDNIQNSPQLKPCCSAIQRKANVAVTVSNVKRGHPNKMTVKMKDQLKLNLKCSNKNVVNESAINNQIHDFAFATKDLNSVNILSKEYNTDKIVSNDHIQNFPQSKQCSSAIQQNPDEAVTVSNLNGGHQTKVTVKIKDQLYLNLTSSNKNVVKESAINNQINDSAFTTKYLNSVSISSKENSTDKIVKNDNIQNYSQSKPSSSAIKQSPIILSKKCNTDKIPNNYNIQNSPQSKPCSSAIQKNPDEAVTVSNLNGGHQTKVIVKMKDRVELNLTSFNKDVANESAINNEIYDSAFTTKDLNSVNILSKEYNNDKIVKNDNNQTFSQSKPYSSAIKPNAIILRKQYNTDKIVNNNNIQNCSQSKPCSSDIHRKADGAVTVSNLNRGHQTKMTVKMKDQLKLNLKCSNKNVVNESAIINQIHDSDFTTKDLNSVNILSKEYNNDKIVKNDNNQTFSQLKPHSSAIKPNAIILSKQYNTDKIVDNNNIQNSSQSKPHNSVIQQNAVEAVAVYNLYGGCKSKVTEKSNEQLKLNQITSANNKIRDSVLIVTEDIAFGNALSKENNKDKDNIHNSPQPKPCGSEILQNSYETIVDFFLPNTKFSWQLETNKQLQLDQTIECNNNLDLLNKENNSDKIVNKDTFQPNPCISEIQQNSNKTAISDISEIDHGQNHVKTKTDKDLNNWIDDDQEDDHIKDHIQNLNYEYAENNLKEMIEAYKTFKNKRDTIQFPLNWQKDINEYSLNSMLRADELLLELHVNIIVIRALVSNLKDHSMYRQALYALSEDFFIIFNEFLQTFPISNIFNINQNYEKAKSLNLKLVSSSCHSGTYKMFARRARQRLPKIRVQFEQIRNISINNQNVFAKCQDFFEAVFRYFENLHYALRTFEIFFNKSENKEFVHQIYVGFSNEYPINSKMMESKFLVFFTSTDGRKSLLGLNTNNRPHKLKNMKNTNLNIDIENNDNKNNIEESSNDALKKPMQKLNVSDNSEHEEKIYENEVTKENYVSFKELNTLIKNEPVDIDNETLDQVCENEAMSDFAKCTQDLRNELHELFGDIQDSEGPLKKFIDLFKNHVGADDC